MSTHQDVESTNHLSIASRVALLVLHYFFGPLLGLELRLIAPDRQLPSYELVAMWLLLASYSALAVGFMHDGPLVSLGIVLSLLPVLVYACSSIAQLILEYRAYLSGLGIALLLALASTYSLSTFITVLALLIFYMAQTYSRNYTFSSSSLFWKQATSDCSDPGILSNYIYHLNKAERFGEVDQIVADIIGQAIPESRTLLINLAVTRMGSSSQWDQSNNANLTSARQLMESIVAQWPSYVDGWRNLGVMLYYERQVEQALDAFSHALDLDVMDSSSWLGKGECYKYLGRNADAASCLRTALDLSPQVEGIRTKLMEVLLLAGLMDEFKIHQAWLEGSGTYYVTEENARYLV